MKGSTIRSLCAMVAAAGVITACSDGTAPHPVSTIPDRGGQSAIRSAEPTVGAITTVDFPGATATLLFAINDAGVAVGRYVSAGRTHGFMRSAEGELTTIDFPGAGFTAAGAINNDGDIVGWYTLPSSAAIRHGFLLRDGVFTSFDPPGSTFTNTLGINQRGDIVGRYCTRSVCREPGSGDFHGFLLRDGEFTTIDVPGSVETNAWKINSPGEIVGSSNDASGLVSLFTLRNGELVTFGLPVAGALSADNGGINARGDVVGKYCDTAPCLIGPTGRGFAITGGRFRRIDVPGALGSSAYGINARRQVVGGYFDANRGLHAYMTRLEN
jgi:uncharacterized membrane protein